MKLDKHFSFIRVCPETEKTITDNQYLHSNGICPHCGNKSSTSIVDWPEKQVTHERRISGKWNRPNLFDIVIGKSPVFIRKRELT